MEPTSTVRFCLVLKHLGDKRSTSGFLTANSDAPSWRNYLGFLQPAPVDFSPIYISLQAFPTEKQVSPRKNLTLWTCSYLLQMSKCFPSFPPHLDFLLARSQYYAILHNKYSSHFHNGNSAPQNQGSSSQSFDKDSSTPVVQKTTDFLDSRLLKPGSKGFCYHVSIVMFVWAPGNNKK